MDIRCFFICEEDLLELLKEKILKGIDNELNTYKENKQQQELISEEIKDVENKIKRLERLNRNYPEVVNNKKFNFFERYIFKRKEYKQYIEDEQKRRKGQEEKDKIQVKIENLQKKLQELQEKNIEAISILNGFDYKGLHSRYEICKGADSLDKLGLSEETAVEILKNDGIQVFMGKSTEELAEFRRYLEMNRGLNYQIGVNALKECINTGLKCTTDNFKFLNNHIYNLDHTIDTEISTLPVEYQEKLKEIADQIGKLPLFVDMKSGLFSENTLNEFDITSIVRLYKYSYLPYNDNVAENGYKISSKKAIDFETLFQADNLNNFLTLYRNILGNNSNKIDIIQFNKIAKIYLKNKNIFDEIINNQELINELLPNIKIFCYSTEPRYLKNIKNIEDLRNIKEIIKTNLIKYYANSTKDPAEIISSIFGIDLDVTTTYGIFKINDAKLEKLSKAMKENQTQEFIGDVKSLRKYTELIYSLNYQDMKESDFEQVVNELFNLSENELAILYKVFGNVQRDLTKTYGNELTQCLEKTNQLMEDISEGKLELKSELQRDYENSGVDYFILRDKATFIQHVMNAYARNYDSATLDIFSDSKKSVICQPSFSTSSLTNISQTYLDSTKKVGQGHKKVSDDNYGIDSPNNVVLLFSHINPNSLVCFGNSDCGMQSARNRLESINSYINVGANPSITFDTVEDTIKNCISKGNDTTEYVFLFEDEEGKKIKPSAVRVMGGTPSIYEIEAAQQLGVPLIKLEKALDQEIEEDLQAERKISHSTDVSEIFEKLNHTLSNAIERVPKIQRNIDSMER